MDVRGKRECKSCGGRWSYFETGSVECPECGSLQSVGVGERAVHTDSDADLDLSEARAVAGNSLNDGLSLAVDACREYCQSRGFIAGGELLTLDDTYLGAQELRYVSREIGERMRVTEAEESYAITLLNDVTAGERPVPENVPESLRACRGLGYAAAARAYRSGIRTYAAGQLSESERGLLEQIRAHEKRIDVLDGDVPAEDSERLALAANEIAGGIRGDETAIERAREHLDRLE